LHSAISQSLDWLCSHPESSTCTAQLLNKDQTIQASGGFFPNLANVFTWCLSLDDLPFVNKLIKPIHPHTPNFYTKDRFYLKDHPQDWVTGAFLLTRKSILDKVKGFDENYFMYGEEVELSYRIKKTTKNNQVWYLIGPQIIHLGGASATNRIDPIVNEYKGILSFFKKHKSNFQYQIVRILLKINAFSRAVIHFSPLYLQACSKI
jgi:GT2 family glycosyltransferase